MKHIWACFGEMHHIRAPKARTADCTRIRKERHLSVNYAGRKRGTSTRFLRINTGWKRQQAINTLIGGVATAEDLKLSNKVTSRSRELVITFYHSIKRAGRWVCRLSIQAWLAFKRCEANEKEWRRKYFLQLEVNS